MIEPDDTEKTVIPQRFQQPPVPGEETNSADAQEHLALPAGTRIAEFEITRIIGIGGFGIVYLARDDSLGRDVALKEYMPSSLALRNDGITVTPRSGRNAEAFSAGLKSFINEARMLALFDHPSLVKVYRFWEANGTAYMVMPYYEGQTLKKALSDMQTRPTEAWLRQLLAPLLDALEIIHSKHCFHRDIAPDNIFLLPNGQPVLLDFGAARQVIGDMVSSLTVILKPGFAPIEQYAGDPNMPQGAWTDIYALGAVLHFAITGAAPVVAVGRLIRDTYVPLEQTCRGRYSESLLKAIDQSLLVKMNQRPQSVTAFRSLLDIADAPAKSPVAPRPIRPAAVSTTPATPAKHRLVWAGGALGVLAIGVATALFVNEVDNKPLASRPAPVQPTPTPQPPEQAAAQTPIMAPATPSAPETTRVFDPKALMDQVQQNRDIEHRVDVRVEKSRVVIGKDKLRFRIQSAKGGYVYVLMLGTNQDLILLFPNAMDRNNKLSAGQELLLPGTKWGMDMASEGPSGVNYFVAIASDQPRDFSAAGMKQGKYFGEFSMNVLRDRFLSSPTAASILSGQARCPASAGVCSTAYGAVQFSIEEVVTAPPS
jgi:serine/threonine protein kinase